MTTTINNRFEWIFYPEDRLWVAECDHDYFLMVEWMDNQDTHPLYTYEVRKNDMTGTTLDDSGSGFHSPMFAMMAAERSYFEEEGTFNVVAGNVTWTFIELEDA